jgi:hypothetical protein
MGNMCRRKSEEDFIQELVNLSRSSLDSGTIYHIMMLSGYNAKELVVLYKRFSDLDVEKRGMITNSEFFEMAELRLSPFLKRMKSAITMLIDEEILKLKGTAPGDEFLDGPLKTNRDRE